MMHLTDEHPSNSKILFLLCFLSFFASVIQNIYTPIIPKLQSVFEVPLFWINITVGGFIFIVAIMQIILGKFIDSQNQKRMLIISLLIILISNIICSFTTNFIVFSIFRLIQAVGCGMLPLISVTLIAKLTEQNTLSNSMANYQIFLSCAPAIAPLAGGFIGDKYGYSGIFSLLSIISLILFVIIFILKLPSINKENSNETSKVYYAQFFKNKKFCLIIIFGFFVFFAYFSILVYLPVLLSGTYNISTSIIGLLFLPMTVSMILGSLFYKKIANRIIYSKILNLLLIAFPITLLLFGLLQFLNLFVVAILTFSLGFLVGIAPALMSTIISNLFTELKGAALGLFNFIRYTGMALGSISIGLFSIPLTTIYFVILAAIFILISVFNFYIINKELKIAYSTKNQTNSNHN
ncbi:MFS transporter [Microbacteriaceae bacterium 4G12]